MATDAGKQDAAGCAALASEHGRRMRYSLFLALGLYLPLLGVFLWRMPTLAFTPAGNPSTVSLSFAQIVAAAGGLSEAPMPPQQEAGAAVKEQPVQSHAEPEVQPELTPEPEVRPELTPEPVRAPAEQAKSAVKKLEPKKAQEPRRKAPRAQTAQKSPAAEVVRKTDEGVPGAAGAKELSESANKSPDGASVAASATRGEAGVATLIYGETDDPFLARVRRSVEANVEYPRKARMMRLQGRSVVQFVVAADGKLRDVKVYASSGHEILDAAVVKAVRRAQSEWGMPERVVRLRFPIEFKLRG